MPKHNERLKKYITKEEGFVDEFGIVANLVAEELGDDWEPDAHCNDDTRKLTKMALELGHCVRLVFEGAAIYHADGGFSSAEVILQSSKRAVGVRVEYEGKELVAQKTGDRAID